MIYFIYNCFLYFVYPLILLSAIFSNKLRKSIKIRFSPLNIPDFSNKKIFWFHAASVGEYEQIRYFILKIKKKHPKIIIIVSVLSYSAYSQCYENQIADFFFPLPFDLYFNIKNIMNKIKPNVIFYSRYDVWPNMARIAYKKGVRQVLVSATLSETSLRKRFPFSLFYSKVYSYLDQIFVIDQTNKNRFQKMNLKAFIAGDTRYDSIWHRITFKSQKSIQVDILKKTIIPKNKKILIAGSTYNLSEKFLLQFMSKSVSPPFLILAPHHVAKDNIYKVEQRILKYSLPYLKYTDFFKKKPLNITPSILLVDVYGILLHLYAIGDLCYIGGGWRGLIHSTIEPAFFKIPILTGPHINNSQDAIDLEKIGLIKKMKNTNYNEVESWYTSHHDTAYKNTIYEKTSHYIKNKFGAFDKIYNELAL